MKKIKLDIVGLSYSQTQSGAYALILNEAKGKRRLPIIIGGFEAQAIAIEMENMKPSRPLTHDLFKNFAETFEIQLKEVIVYNLVEGIFYAKLICARDNNEVEIDARTSDAIALAVRFNCPIFTYEFILNSAGIIMDEDVAKEKEKEGAVTEAKATKEPAAKEKEKEKDDEDYKKKSLEDLKELLQKVLDREDYEKATKIRDEINRRKKS
ncbi:MAG TPA: bifunctional nuclease domain-containing protein [Bacteroidia bacterium]|jgi:bifunctional DNase/RNase|nr:bifunctional nuclease domain-containing protein [Bacteroidia bacterium]